MNKALYILHSTINSRTYKRFRFRNYFRLPSVEFYIHENLKSSDPARIDACLLGICEVISGHFEYPELRELADSTGETQRMADEGCRVEIPPDSGLQGECTVAFDFESRKVYLGSIVTAQKIFTFVPAF
jgi:hypothetical protein